VYTAGVQKGLNVFETTFFGNWDSTLFANDTVLFSFLKTTTQEETIQNGRVLNFTWDNSGVVYCGENSQCACGRKDRGNDKKDEQVCCEKNTTCSAEGTFGTWCSGIEPGFACRHDCQCTLGTCSKGRCIDPYN
jgi:hypothetical protein